MSICGEPHPEKPGVVCTMPETPVHPWHTAVRTDTVPPTSIDWRNEDWSEATKPRTKAQRAEKMASLTERMKVATGVPAEAAAAWSTHDKGVWIEQAKKTLRTYCLHHGEPFTTPEDIWPLLDAPAEMRALSTVVQHALRQHWIKEVSARRLNEVYTSRDGHLFPMNKISPIYQSRIFIAPERDDA